MDNKNTISSPLRCIHISCTSYTNAVQFISMLQLYLHSYFTFAWNTFLTFKILKAITKNTVPEQGTNLSEIRQDSSRLIMEGRHLVAAPECWCHKEYPSTYHVCITVALDQPTQHKQATVPQVSPQKVTHDLKKLYLSHLSFQQVTKFINFFIFKIYNMI